MRNVRGRAPPLTRPFGRHAALPSAPHYRRNGDPHYGHHLQLAGRSDPLFTDDATALIHGSGRGKPRAVNRLALAALIAACAAGKNLIDETSARSAITETSHDPAATP